MPEVGKFLLSLGFPGASIIALGFAVKILYDENRNRESAHVELIKNTTEVISKVSSAIDNLTEEIRRRN